MPQLITLTTDFGLTEEYVAVMKGVIYSRCPNAVIVDMNHCIPPQDVNRAARMIHSAYRFFPAGTVHVVVVDPGVGSSRRILVFEAGGQLFLAPDNGVMTPLFPLAREIYEVSNSALFLQPLSHTFHGRDIFAPVAAYLASGNLLSSAGNKVVKESLVQIDMRISSRRGDRLLGQVTDIDHFGNLITNIDHGTLVEFCSGNFNALKIQAGNVIIKGIVTAYNEAGDNQPVALIGSRDFLEISIFQKSAADNLGLGTGSTLCLIIE